MTVVVVRRNNVRLVTSRRGDPGAAGPPGAGGITEEDAQALVDAETARAEAAEAALQDAVDAEAATARNANNLSSGTVDDARLPAGVARDAEVAAAVAAEAALARNANNLTSGTVLEARIPATVARDAEVSAALAAEVVARDAAISAAVDALIDAAPGTLNTLAELAAALGDDPNFAAAITAALAGKQPVDSDLTAIAALTTTPFGRALLEVSNAAALRAAAGLGSAAVENTTAFDAAGAAAAAQAASQPLDSDLTAIAALTTTSFGRALLEAADAAALRTAAGLGTAAVANTGVANAGDVPTRSDADTRYAPRATFPVVIGVALSDETTAITAGTNKCVIRAPFAFTLTAVRANLNTASSAGTPTVDINKNGVTVLSTKLTIDANELTSLTATAAPVISVSAVADDDEIEFDIDVAGTGAKGLKVWLIGTRVI